MINQKTIMKILKWLKKIVETADAAEEQAQQEEEATSSSRGEEEEVSCLCSCQSC